MGGNPFRGANYLFRGFSMMAEPGLRAFVIVPLIINLLLFTLAIYLLMAQFSNWVAYWMSYIPNWLSFLDWLMWLVFALLVLISVYFTFSIIANFIAAPFNGILAEKVEQRLRGEVNSASGWQEMLAIIPRTVGRELSKLAYYLPRFLIMLALSFIPFVGLVLWFFFGAWMMAIQYCDYPMDNNQVSFKNMLALLKKQRFSSLGFGSLTSLGMLVPVLNLIIMPAAVVGATIFWVEEFSAANNRRQA